MTILSLLTRILPVSPAYAHCDIPCGIYDPHMSQVAAHTIIRMTQMIDDLQASSENAPFGERKTIIHSISRMTHVKEDHANILEHELSTLKDDYFKEEHLKTYPELTKLFEQANKQAAKARQGIDMESAKGLLETVMQIAEIFYKSKGGQSARVKSLFPTGLDIVVQK